MIAALQGTKGRSASASSITAGAITTSLGSILLAVFAWDTGTFTDVLDSKNNPWIPLGTEITFGTSGRVRAYFSPLATVGASHTITATQTGTSSMTILVLEVAGAIASFSSFDQNANAHDATSPFASGLTALTAVANELIVGMLIGGSSSNPATHAIDGSSTPASGWAITAAAEETNAVSFYSGAIASVRVTATGQYQGAWTETGSGEGQVWTATFKEAAGSFDASLFPIQKLRDAYLGAH